jgi:hypothetical protein
VSTATSKIDMKMSAMAKEVIPTRINMYIGYWMLAFTLMTKVMNR